MSNVIHPKGLPWLRRAGTTILFLVVALTISALPASAAGTLHYIGTATINGSTTGMCTSAEMNATNINKASTLTYTNTPASCTTAKVVPAGYLSVQAKGYIDGAYCGQTAEYYSPGAQTGHIVSSTICGNPAGSQNFKTLSRSGFLQSGGMSYYGIYSPSQTY